MLGAFIIRKLALYSLLLFVILTLTVSSVALISRALPIPERAATLHIGDLCPLPCWIGITPGKTTVSEAERLIAKVYGNMSIERVTSFAGELVTAGDKQSLQIALYPVTDLTWHGTRPDSVIDYIELNGNAVKMPLGLAIASLGKPDYVTLSDAAWGCISITTQSGLTYRSCNRSQDFVTEHIIMQQSVTNIALVPLPDPVKTGTYVPISTKFRWHGFGAYHVAPNHN